MDMVTYLMLKSLIQKSKGAVSENFAPEYDPSRTYEAGDYAIIDGILYKYTGSQWNEANVGDALKELQNGKLNSNQGEENAGKFMVVNDDGNVVPMEGSGGTVIIDHTLSIRGAAADAKVTGDSISKERKRVDALYKLTEGQLWDTEIGDSPAYMQNVEAGGILADINKIAGRTVVWNQMVGATKQIPESGEMYQKTVPENTLSAEVNSIGGKTIVWNQLNRNNASGDDVEEVHFTKNSDGSWSAAGTATGNASKSLAAYGTGILGVAGHKYLIYSGLSISTYIAADGSISYMTGSLTNNGSTVFTLPNNRDGSKLVLIFRTVGDHVYDTSGYAFFCDLTVMFGAGNEPADNTDPRVPGIIEYALSHLEFDEGSLLSAAVTDIVSKHGEVVWNQLVSFASHNTETVNGVTFTKNGTTWTVSGTATEKAVKAISNDIRVEGNKYLYTGCPDGGSLETYHLGNDVGNGYISTADFTTGVNVSIVVEAGTTVSNLVFTPAVINLTRMFGAGNEPADTSDQRIAAIEAYAEAHPERNARQTIGQTTVNGQITFVTDPVIDEVEIPVSLRTYLADKGYGWSAGSVYNEIDWVRKVYIQRVGSVDLGMLEWTYVSNYPAHFVTMDIINSIVQNQNAQMICPKYEVYHGTSWPSYDKIITDWASHKFGNIIIHDSTFDNVQDLKSAMSGVMLYYELAEPVEYDISSYLTDDNTLTVEPGGSLAFVQTATQLPVPTSLDWTKTAWTETLDSTHKYIYVEDGTETFLNGAASQAIAGTDRGLIDLTRMLGTGSEYGYLTEKQSRYVLDYRAENPEKNAGELVSAKVTGVASKHREVVWNQLRPSTSTGTVNWSTADNLVVSGSEISVTRISSTLNYYVSYNTQLLFQQGHKVLLSMDGKANRQVRWRAILNSQEWSTRDFSTEWNTEQHIFVIGEPAVSNFLLPFYIPSTIATDDDIVSIRNVIIVDLTQMFGAGNEPSATSDPRIAGIIAYAEEHPEYNAEQTIGQTTVDGQIVFVTNPLIDELEIPISLREYLSDKGYGYSAGNVYNEIDWVRKVYIQRVESVDMGTLTWSKEKDNTFSINLPRSILSGALLTEKYVQRNAVSPAYSNYPDKSIWNNVYLYSQKNVVIKDTSYNDSLAFKTAMSGVTLLYELADPIEYDISSYLPADNSLEVETGGTVTFVQSNDLKLEVLNEVEYLVKLEEVVGA